MPRTQRPTVAQWRRWVDGFDALFARYDPGRAVKFDLILDLLAAQRRSKFTLVDLGCGPGVVLGRVLQRFPGARVIGVDQGPKVLRMAEQAWRPYRGRARWVQAEVQDPKWRSGLPARSVDYVISALCLHPLPPGELRRLYRDLGRLIRPGGLFIDADLIPWSARHATFDRLSETVRELEVARGLRGSTVELARDAERYWKGVRRSGAMADLFAAQDAERRRPKGRAPAKGHSRELLVDVDEHLAYLRAAGFREASVVWQHLDRRVLVARR